MYIVSTIRSQNSVTLCLFRLRRVNSIAMIVLVFRWMLLIKKTKLHGNPILDDGLSYHYITRIFSFLLELSLDCDKKISHVRKLNEGIFIVNLVKNNQSTA